MLKCFTIHDSKAGVYARPFFLQSAGVAMRIFGDMANDPNDPVGSHPEDYTLFEIASWDEDTARFTQDGALRSLANAIELKTEFAQPQQVDLEDAIKNLKEVN